MDLTERRKRLRFRAWHRGTKEADLIFGHFVDQNVESFDEATCDWFDCLFKEQEQETLEWVTGKTPLPDQYDTPIMHAIQKLDFLPNDGPDGSRASLFQDKDD